MIRYHFDLYPRDDPRDGARVVRFTKLQSAEYRGEANGTGAGRFSIRADTAEAQNIDPAGLQYVRVVREDTVAETELVVGGFFLDSGDFTALDERGTRLLTFGGAGTLSYLARSVMASHTYISPIFTGQDPFDDTWRLYAQSTIYANGNFLGAMLWRVIYEAQHFTPGSHKHADGVVYTDTHDDDRIENAIPALTMGFDAFNDSNGNAWAVSSGEFKAQVGENVLGVVKRLMEAGLYVSMDPDTFELNAYPAGTHRRDRTGASWGAAAIRFQAPTDGTLETGNIKSDANRAIAAFIRRSWILAGSGDVYGDAVGTSDIPWEGFYYSDTQDVDALENIAGVQLGARDDAGDTLRLRGRLGNDPANGYYLPFEHVLLDDLGTIHTGTGQWDYNEQDFPVAAITLQLRPGGDWDVWYDMGSSFSATERRFQVTPVPAHNHGPNPQLCLPGTATSGTVYEQFDWDSGQETIQHPVATFGTQMLVQDVATGPEPGADGTSNCGSFGNNSAVESNPIAVTAGTTYRVESKSQGFGHSWPTTPFGQVNWSIGLNWRDASGVLVGSDIIASHTGAQDGPFLTDAGGDFTAPTGATRMHFKQLMGVQTDETANTKWDSVTISTVSGGASGDGHPDLVGTSNRATRCDHRHDVHRDRPPAITDDGAAGYKLGTIWAQLDSLAAPTAIVGTWMLVDTTTGAAVWLEIGGGDGASDLDALTDVTITAPAADDNLRYNGSAWVNDSRKWEAVTDNPGTGPELVWDGDDLVHEWSS